LELLQAEIMGENKVDGPFEGLKKLSDQKKVAKYKISSAHS
jgi:hypothetical protein